MTSGGLDSHIYDVGETSRLIQSQRNVAPPTHDWSWHTIGWANEYGILFEYQTTYTKRFMSPGGLYSLIYDVGEPSRCIQNNVTLDHTNTIGVHANNWSILFGYCNTKT